MAILQYVQVNIQQKHDGSWIDLKEFDEASSLKEASNSNRHWTTNVLIKEGLFRFVVSLDESFQWLRRDALLFNLTWHQGLSLKDYPVLALNPSYELPEDKKYDTLGYMAVNPVTGRLEYILESVYTPIASPEEESQGYARTTFDFKKIEGVLDNHSSNKKQPSSDKHTMRISVDLCRVCGTSVRQHKPTTSADDKNRRIARQALFPQTDLEPQGLLDFSSTIQKVEGPGYTASRQSVTFNFIYRTQMPNDAVQIDDVDIIDKTVDTLSKRPLTPRRATPATFQLPGRAYSQARNSESDFVPAANEQETQNDPGNISASLSSTTDQENIYDGNDNSDESEFKPWFEVCTPPLNPTGGSEPVRSAPVLAFTSANVSNSVSDPLPTPASTPTTACASVAGQAPAPNSQSVAEALLQDLSTLKAARQADISERESDLLNVESQIEINKKAIEQNNIDIRELEAKLADLKSKVHKKTNENESLQETKKKLRDEISDTQEKEKEDEIAFEDAKKSYEILKARVDKTNCCKRRRSQVSLDSSPYANGRRTRDRSSSAMQTDSE